MGVSAKFELGFDRCGPQECYFIIWSSSGRNLGAFKEKNEIQVLGDI